MKITTLMLEFAWHNLAMLSLILPLFQVSALRWTPLDDVAEAVLQVIGEDSTLLQGFTSLPTQIDLPEWSASTIHAALRTLM